LFPNSANPILSMLLMEETAEFRRDPDKVNRLKKKDSPTELFDLRTPSTES
jgi:hypothetical protein